MLAAVKGKSLRDGLRPPLTAAPRSAPAKSGRDEEMSQARSNKEMQLTTPLTAIAPYKSTVKGFGRRPLAGRSCGLWGRRSKACYENSRRGAEGSDKSARAATIFTDNGAPQALVACYENSRRGAEGSDKSARAATIFTDNGAPQALVASQGGNRGQEGALFGRARPMEILGSRTAGVCRGGAGGAQSWRRKR